MKKLLLFIVSIAFFLLIPVSFAAVGVQITPSNTTVNLYTDQVTVLSLTVENKQNVPDTFTISFLPIEGVSITAENYRLDIGAQDSVTTKISFTPLLCAAERSQVEEIRIRSITRSDVNDAVDLLVNVIRKSSVCFSELKLNKYVFDPSETVKIQTSLLNTANIPSSQFLLKTSISYNGASIKSYDNNVAGIDAKSSRDIENDYSLDKYASPGEYTVDVTLNDVLNNLLDEKKIKFTVNNISKLPSDYTEKTTSLGILSIGVTVKVRNDGNTPSPSFYVTESIPFFAGDLFEPETPVTFTNTSDVRIIYSWFVPSLNPGQEVTINYRFILWKAWIVLIVVAAAVYLAFKYVFKIFVIKKTTHIGKLSPGSEVAITIDVRNRTLREIREIVVRDFVPSLVKVVSKFDTMRATVNETRGGTEVLWRIDSLKPGEERVLSYRIKPNVEITGSLRLPNALVKYAGRNRERKTALSNSLFIKAR